LTNLFIRNKMRKTIFTLAIAVGIAGATFTSCQSSASKVENAEDKLRDANNNAIEAKMNLDETKQDSISEYQKFKKESDAKIEANEKSIAEFKARIATEKMENKAKYEESLLKLEQKNSDMKKKLSDYKEDGQEKWSSFKNEFNHDMDELGKAFNGLTVKNTK